MRLGPAHAKLNLALEVVDRRPDGYHEIRTVFVAIDWHDLVSVSLVSGPSARSGGGDGRHRAGGPAAEPGMAADDALVPRAAAALARLAAAAGHPVAVHTSVFKRIPVAAGLGGGSADAAAVLRLGAAELADRGVAFAGRSLAAAAADLGSDVPAMVVGGAALGAGRGELLTPLLTPSLHAAVAFAGASSTAAAYAALRPRELGGDGRADRVADALRAGRAPDRDDLGSALETAACRAAPPLAAALGRLRSAAPGSTWHLTGSGGAAFALAADALEASWLAERARRCGLAARACRSVAAPAEPVGS